MTQAFQNIERAFDNIQGIGRVWAAYGVNLSKAALETSAERLKATAAYLETLSQRMEEFKTQINPPQPTTEPAADQQPPTE